MTTATVTLHRVFRAPPERVYRAFLEAGPLSKWLPPYGFFCTVDHIDARVGGSYRMSFTNFGSGQAHSFAGRYLELSPSARIRYTDRFDDPDLAGEMTTTILFKEVMCGTDLSVVQEGLPEMIPVEMCYLGWQQSLVQLGHLVETEVAG